MCEIKFHRLTFPLKVTLILIIQLIYGGCTTHSGIMPAHGNWCGPAHPRNGGDNVPALDALDEACKQHDLCYASNSYLDCSCDEAFINRLNGSFGSASLNVKAKAFRDWFGLQPCAGIGTIKKPFSFLRDNFMRNGNTLNDPLVVIFAIPLKFAWTIITIPHSMWESYSHEKVERETTVKAKIKDASEARYTRLLGSSALYLGMPKSDFISKYPNVSVATNGWPRTNSGKTYDMYNVNNNDSLKVSSGYLSHVWVYVTDDKIVGFGGYHDRKKIPFDKWISPDEFIETAKIHHSVKDCTMFNNKDINACDATNTNNLGHFSAWHHHKPDWAGYGVSLSGYVRSP